MIPLYNAQKYFDETMESLLSQTYKSIEIIIVDDGSTDGSLEIAKKYERVYDNIKVHTQKNAGAQVARNKAFELSRGQYIQYFDADDIMDPDKIASQINSLKMYEFSENVVATGKWMSFKESIHDAEYTDMIINKNYDDKFLFFKEAWENVQYFVGPSWLISKKLHLKVGKWNESLVRNQDGEFFTRVAYEADKIIYVDESIIYYRKGVVNSITAKKSLNSLRSHLDSYRIYGELVKNDLEEHGLHKAVASLYSVFYGNYYPLEDDMRKEVLDLLKELGFNQPVIAFKPGSLWIVKLFGVDTGLYLRSIKTKLVALLNGIRSKRI